jgi:Ala-tRNA(Pro) deacylase
MGSQKVHEHLITHGVAFEPKHHRRVFQAEKVAALEHVSGHDVAKTVMVAVGHELVMIVLPASHRLDMEAVRRELGEDARLAEEGEFGPVFQDCEVGAETPFGNLYGILVLMDRHLAERERMVCRDGTHEETIEIAVADYLDLVRPRIVDVTVSSIGASS